MEKGLFGRREALGFGASFGVFEGLFQLSHHETAFAAEGNGLCEFTVAPSGLAFCDKVVGYGAEAVQGQLIKVMQQFLFAHLAIPTKPRNLICLLSQ